MKIGIIGSGTVGSVVGPRWASKGHAIIYGSRDPAGDKMTALLDKIGSNAQAVEIKDVANGCDAVLLATPFAATKEAIRVAGGLSGKIVLDATNPLAKDLSGLTVGFDDSGAEQVSRWALGARVAKVLNMTGAGNMDDPNYSGQAASMFVCGDDDKAKSVASQLASDLGFDVVDAGPLISARLLEPMALLWIKLAVQLGNGPDVAFGLLRR